MTKKEKNKEPALGVSVGRVFQERAATARALNGRLEQKESPCDGMQWVKGSMSEIRLVK